MSPRTSRRQFLKGSAAIGGAVGIAGCGESMSGDGTPLPPVKSVDVSVTTDASMRVALVFENELNPALEEIEQDVGAEDLVTFEPASTAKSVQDLDTEVSDGYLLAITATDAAERANGSTREIVSTDAVTIADAIPLASGVTVEDLFTFSVETVTKDRHDIEFPDETGTDPFEFPFRKTHSDLTVPAVREISRYEELASADDIGVQLDHIEDAYDRVWKTPYSIDEFPVHAIQTALPPKSVPSIEYYNTSHLLSIRAFAESKRRLWEYLFAQFGYLDAADERAWNDTRKLVRESISAAAGMAAPVDEVGSSGTILETYMDLAGTASQVGKAPLTILSVLLAQKQIDQAADEWGAALLELFNDITVQKVFDNARITTEMGDYLQRVEEQTILPSLVLSSPENVSRKDAQRVYDKHLDMERTLLYDFIRRVRDEVNDVMAGSIPSFNRATLYEGTERSGHTLVDVTDGRVKSSGTGTTNSEIAGLAGRTTDRDFADDLARRSRIDPQMMGYTMEVPGVNSNTAVGKIYDELRVGSSGDIKDEGRLRQAKYFTHILDTVDMLLNITRAQQTLLQLETDVYGALSEPECAIPREQDYEMPSDNPAHLSGDRPIEPLVDSTDQPVTAWEESVDEVSGSPVVVDSVLLVPVRRRVIAYDACTGAEQWTYDFTGDVGDGASISAGLAYSQSRLYIGFSDGTVVSFDIDTQKVLSTAEVGSEIYGITPYEGSLYVSSGGEGGLAGSSPEFAKLRSDLGGDWSVETRSFLSQSPAVAEGGIVLSGGKRLLAYSHTGDELWSFGSATLDYAYDAPAIKNGRVYHADGSNLLRIGFESDEAPTIVDTENGSDSTPVFDEDELLVASYAGIDRYSYEGGIRYRGTHEAQHPVNSAPIVAGDITYAVDKEGVLHAWEGTNRSPRWTYDLNADEYYGYNPFVAGKKLFAISEHELEVIRGRE